MNVKRLLRAQSFLVLFLWLTGCAPGTAVPVQPSPAASLPPTASPIPAAPTPSGLSPANVNSIVPLRRFGLGVPTDVAYASDGSLIAVSSSLGVYRYDAQSFEELPLIETDAYVWSLAFSSDSDLIATGEDNGGLRLWDAREGALVREMKGHVGRVDCLAFSPDGQLLASAAYNDEAEPHHSIVKIWRVEDGALLVKSVEYAERPFRVNALAFSPNGDRLALGVGSMVFFLDGADWHLIDTLEGYDVTREAREAEIAALTFSPNGEILATAAKDHTVQLWRVSNGERIRTIEVPDSGWVTDLVFSPDGKILIGEGNPLRFWNTDTGEPLESPSISGDQLALSPDGASLAVLGAELELWRLADFSRLHTWTGYTDSIYSLDVSPDGTLLAAGTWQGPARLWQVKDGSLLHTLQDAQEGMHFSPDGQTLLAVQYDVQFWQVREGTLRNRYQWFCTAESAAFSPNGRMLAVGLAKDGVEVLSTSEREILFALNWETKFDNPISAVAFSPDSRLLATGDREPTVRLWSMEDGQLVSALEGHDSDVDELAFSPDGKVLASSAHDKTVRLWRVEDGSLLQILDEPAYVFDVAFSPNGQLLAAAYGDNTIKLWDLQGNLLRTLSAHTAIVRSVVFLPDGMTLASGSADGTIRLWGLTP